MPSDSNASFIPKRNPSKKLKRVVTRRVYIFTFASYVSLFVVLITAVSLFAYKQYLQRQAVEEVTALKAEIEGFKVADMQTVLEYERRVQAAENRFSNQISIATLLALIERSTAQTIQYKDFMIERTSDTELTFVASIISKEFNSAIFQRNLYEETGELEGLTLDGISYSLDGSVPAAGSAGGSGARAWYVNPDESAPQSNQTDQSSDSPVINMIAKFALDPSSFPTQQTENTFVPSQLPVDTTAPVATTSNQSTS